MCFLGIEQSQIFTTRPSGSCQIQICCYGYLHKSRFKVQYDRLWIIIVQYIRSLCTFSDLPILPIIYGARIFKFDSRGPIFFLRGKVFFEIFLKFVIDFRFLPYMGMFFFGFQSSQRDNFFFENVQNFNPDRMSSIRKFHDQYFPPIYSIIVLKPLK